MSNGPNTPIPQEWIKGYVDKLLLMAKELDGVMQASCALRAEHVMDMVEAFRAYSPPSEEKVRETDLLERRDHTLRFHFDEITQQRYGVKEVEERVGYKWSWIFRAHKVEDVTTGEILKQITK